MRQLLNIIFSMGLLVGLAIEPQIQQFVLHTIKCFNNTDNDTESLIAPRVVLTANELLAYEGKNQNVRSLQASHSEILQKYADEHAAYQASIGEQGHQDWEIRWRRIKMVLHGYKNIREIANESWPGQTADDAAKEMYKSWKKSSGHWSVANGECKIYGIAMVLGKNGIWYACEITAD